MRKLVLTWPAVEFVYLQPINNQRCQNSRLWSLVVSIEKRILAREMRLVAARPGDILSQLVSSAGHLYGPTSTYTRF